MASSGGTGRGDESSALVVLVDGLIERLQRSPLMRRAPAQCTAEEQALLAQLLADLAAVRQVRSAMETAPALRVELLMQHWPELGELLSPPRRGTSAAGRGKSRDGSAGEAVVPSLFDSSALSPEPADAIAPEIAVESESTAHSTQPDLAALLLEALSETGRALNTTQMLSWLETRGVSVAREQVTDTLFRHEDRFRRRGASQWVAVGKEPA